MVENLPASGVVAAFLAARLETRQQRAWKGPDFHEDDGVYASDEGKGHIR